MQPILLFRDDYQTEEERSIAAEYFCVVSHRTDCQDNLVVGRYSCLPYYRELEIDLKNHGCQLINTYQQHRWIADFDYYEVVKDYTPLSWFDHDFRYAPEGAYVVKGKTNSRKQRWNTHMFAPTKREALKIAGELMADPMIGEQGVVYRQYQPLKTYEIGINGLPFTNEWRFFCYQQEVLSHGYYWSIAERPDQARMDSHLWDLIEKLLPLVAEHVNFYVLDIAQRETGEWVLIEINDAQMSGLSENDPHALYRLLYRKLTTA